MTYKDIDIPEFFKSMRLIPLIPYGKKARVAWGNDNNFDLSEYDDLTGYGIDTERNNLIVIDCDVKHDIDGVRNFYDLIDDHEELPQTVTVETPNGGIHFYFKNNSSSQIRSSVSKLSSGVDVRAKGGYIVGPGSKIKLENGEVGEYELENEDIVTIAEVPEWLLKELISIDKQSSSKDEDKKDKNNSHDENNSQVLIERRRALYWAQQKMSEAEAGERETILNKTAFFMGKKRVPLHESLSLVQVAVDRGLPIEEANETFEKGYNDGLNQDELEYDQMIKEYNFIMGKDIKKDPLEPAYYTHVALSHNFADSHPDQFIYWSNNNQWYQYNAVNGTWDKIKESTIVSLVDKYLDNLISEIRTNNKFLTPQIYKLHERLWSRGMIESVAAVCRNRYMITGSEIFDNDDFLLNCKNGVVNLKTGEMSEHSPYYYITQYIPVDYDPKANDKYCNMVIESIDPREKDYLQLLAGQSLIGAQPNYQAALFLHGRGSNGKSTFIDLMLKTSGTYGRLQSPIVLIADKGNSDKYALADFEDLRTAIIEELPNSKVLDTGALKRIVGTSRINARQIYGTNREIKNKSTIFVSCNKLPMVNETDEGTWRRVLVINFPYSYKKDKSEVKSDFDRIGDPRVLHAAQNRTSTAKAFLKWRVDGAMKWFTNDKIEYDVPKSIIKRTAEWNANNDLILSWFNDEIEVSEETKKYYITFEDLLNSFNDNLESKGNYKVSSRFFTTEFNNHKVMSENRLEYKKANTIDKNLTRSPYYTKQRPITPDKYRTNYIIGIKFKDKER